MPDCGVKSTRNAALRQASLPRDAGLLPRAHLTTQPSTAVCSYESDMTSSYAGNTRDRSRAAMHLALQTAAWGVQDKEDKELTRRRRCGGARAQNDLRPWSAGLPTLPRRSRGRRDRGQKGRAHTNWGRAAGFDVRRRAARPHAEPSRAASSLYTSNGDRSDQPPTRPPSPLARQDRGQFLQAEAKILAHRVSTSVRGPARKMLKSIRLHNRTAKAIKWTCRDVSKGVATSDSTVTAR